MGRCPIYQLSDENCKKQIKSYVTDLELTNGVKQPDDKLDFYIMKLLFFTTKIENVNLDIISVLTSYPPDTFSSKFFPLQNMVTSICKIEKSFAE